MRRFGDEDGQVDGDAPFAAGQFGRAVPHFAQRVQAQPWLRGSEPPWHMWGNTQRITTVMEATGAPRQGVTNTLVRVAYKRPETWHWLFQARLLSGPNNDVGFFSRVFVHWELKAGIGRSLQRMTFESGQPFAVRGFDQYTFLWTDPTPFPAGAYIWTAKTRQPPRDFDAAGPFPVGDEVTEICAENLILDVQVVALTAAGNVGALGQEVTVEVSAQFAPKTHLRPDWFREGPEEAAFAGDEVGGR